MSVLQAEDLVTSLSRHLGQGAVLFVDDAVASSLSWNAPRGLAGLMESLRLRSIVSVSEASQLKHRFEGVDKIAFAVSTFLPPLLPLFSELIVSAPRSECIVFSCLSETSHNIFLQQAPHETYFQEITYRLKEWIRQSQSLKGESKRFVKSKAMVVHYPVVHCAIAPDLWLIPSSSSVFPQLIQESTNSNTPPDKITNETFCHVLSALVQQFEMNEDFFAMGPLSVSIARQTLSVLQAHRSSTVSSPSTPTQNRRLAVVLIDRTADIISPCLHADSLPDRIFSLLPRPNEHCFDVRLDFLPIKKQDETSLALSETDVDDEDDWPSDINKSETTLPPIQLALSESRTLIDEHINQRFKSSLLALRKSLVEAIGREKLPYRASKMSKVTATQLSALETTLRDPNTSSLAIIRRNLPLIQFTLATEASLNIGDNRLWDELQGVEKVLMLSAAEEEGGSLLAQIRDILSYHNKQSSERKPIPLKDVLILACICYALLGDILPLSEDDALSTTVLSSSIENSHEVRGAVEAVEESFLMETLVQLLPQHDIESLVSMPVESSANQEPSEIATTAVDELIRRLRAIRVSRSLLVKHTNSSLPPGTPLLKHLVNNLLNPARPPIEGLRHITDGDALNRLFRGFSSRFLNKQELRPSDCSTILIVVVGGVTFSEARDIREAVQAHASTTDTPQIILAGTDLATPDQIYKNLMCTKQH